MSKVMSIRFKDQQVERLGRISRRLGKAPSETVALLVEEALRMAEHPQIDFRDSIAGRHAYVKGSGLAVWEVAMIARHLDWDAEKVADYLNWLPERAQAVLNYVRDYREEIDAELADNDAIDFAALQRMFPHIQRIVVPNDDDDIPSGEAS
jgi:uncharacterized protein (DUF433 family)